MMALPQYMTHVQVVELVRCTALHRMLLCHVLHVTYCTWYCMLHNVHDIASFLYSAASESESELTWIESSQADLPVVVINWGLKLDMQEKRKVG